MKVFASNKLTHTLQTYLGMVTDGGAPRQRLYNDLPSYLVDSEPVSVSAKEPDQLSEEALVSLFSTCILERRLPRFESTRRKSTRWFSEEAKQLNRNIDACCDLSIDIDFMKRKLRTHERVDLEQAAAIVISAIRNDTGITNKADLVPALVAELDRTLLTKSCMWLDRFQINPGVSIEEAKFSRFVDLFRRMSRKQCISTDSWKLSELSYVKDWASFLPLLLRVRRSSPRKRGLFIPQWVFDAANVAPPPKFAVWDKQGYIKPGHEPMFASEPYMNDIVLSRKAFRALQRRILQYHRFWDAATRLRKAIAYLEHDITCSTDFIRSNVLTSDDTLTVAHFFFAVQRRLQRKVVSDLNWTGFLGKGESGNILQNNPDIPTTFEQRLAELSGQNGVPITGHVLPQIDQCCLLMEDYVSVYGNGDPSTLVFVPGSRGGSGRGAVDEYNSLCDILKTLCKAAKDQGLKYPGPVRKFLAKDIMAYNDSFDDDAFAKGRVPGWEVWLAQRREDRTLRSIEKPEVDTALGTDHQQRSGFDS